jgi:hypothetical protein
MVRSVLFLITIFSILPSLGTLHCSAFNGVVLLWGHINSLDLVELTTFSILCIPLVILWAVVLPQFVAF